MKCGDGDLKHNAEMASTQLHWELSQELKCPVCQEYMVSPIMMCENGHNICDGCKESLSECPTCSGYFVNVRNIVLEKFASKAIYPCKYREAGCGEVFAFYNRSIHLPVCLFQSTECPFRKLSGIDCPWTGNLSDIPAHIKDEHESETAEVPAHFKVLLMEFVEGKPYHAVVTCLGELFCLIWERVGDIVKFAVFHFSPKSETTDFKCGIKIGKSAAYDAAARKCHNYLDSDLAKLQDVGCVTFHYNTLLYSIDANGLLWCEIEIGKNKLDGFVSDEEQQFLSVAFARGSEV
jgi:hypothetical protein